MAATGPLCGLIAVDVSVWQGGSGNDYSYEADVIDKSKPVILDSSYKITINIQIVLYFESNWSNITISRMKTFPKTTRKTCKRRKELRSFLFACIPAPPVLT